MHFRRMAAEERRDITLYHWKDVHIMIRKNFEGITQEVNYVELIEWQLNLG